MRVTSWGYLTDFAEPVMPANNQSASRVAQGVCGLPVHSFLAPAVQYSNSVFGVVVIVMGVLVAAWMGFGRVFFGVGGEFVLAYTLTASVALVILNLFTGITIRLANRRHHRIHPQTVIALVLFWVAGIGFGLTVADENANGLDTLMSYWGGETLRGMAIGLSNLFGILALAGSIAGLVFARLDARGPKPEEVPDDVEFVAPLPPPTP